MKCDHNINTYLKDFQINEKTGLISCPYCGMSVVDIITELKLRISDKVKNLKEAIEEMDEESKIFY